MQRYPFGGLPERDPDTVLRATEILASLDSDAFAALFADFCDTVQETGEKHEDCTHTGPLVIIGIDLNDDLTEITALSSAETIEGAPIEPRPYKPDHLQDFDIIGMVQANNHLDTPELIQGALVEQLSTQWHLLMMLEEIPDNMLEFDPGMDSLPSDPGMPPGPDMNKTIDDLFDEFTRALEDAGMPQNIDNFRGPFEDYDPEELDHLDMSKDGVQCQHCGAVYESSELDEAVQCCPAGDGDDEDVPLDEQDRDFDF